MIKRGIPWFELWLTVAMVLGVQGMSNAETDVTSMVLLAQDRLAYDRLSKQSYLNISVKNTSQNTIVTPIKVVVDSVTPLSVTVANADGATIDGKPYFWYSMSTGNVLPGSQTAAKSWKFLNQTAVKFSYATHVVAPGIIEIVNGITIPPAPDVTTNKASIAGVDSNGDGLRDDVERVIAQEFGVNIELYAKAKIFATTLQAAIINPTPAATSAHLDSMRCIQDIQELTDLDKATIATLDTPARRNAYATAFAGAVITEEGCPQ